MNSFRIGVLLAMALVSMPTMAANGILHAITEDGRKVILSADGHWTFDSRANSIPIKQMGDSPLQSPVQAFSLSFDTNQWVLTPMGANDVATKRMFRNKTRPLVAAFISDELPVTTQSMHDSVLSNVTKNGGSVSSLVDETRSIKGRNVGYLRYLATGKDGTEFVFSNLFYGDERGNVQVACYTAQQLFFKYQDECEKFLSGLTIN